MSLNSFFFILYFAVLFIVLFILQFLRKYRRIENKIINVQLVLLLIFSYAFIYTHSWKCCLCVLAYTCFVYFTGLYVNKNKTFLTIGNIKCRDYKSDQI